MILEVLLPSMALLAGTVGLGVVAVDIISRISPGFEPSWSGTPAETLSFYLALVGIAGIEIGILLRIIHRDRRAQAAVDLNVLARDARKELAEIEFPIAALDDLTHSPWGPIIREDSHFEPILRHPSPASGSLLLETDNRYTLWYVDLIHTEILRRMADWLQDKGDPLAAALLATLVVDRERFTRLEKQARQISDEAYVRA